MKWLNNFIYRHYIMLLWPDMRELDAEELVRSRMDEDVEVAYRYLEYKHKINVLFYVMEESGIVVWDLLKKLWQNKEEVATLKKKRENRADASNELECE